MGRPAALPRRRHGGLLLALHAGGERPRRDRHVRREPRARAASAGPSSGSPSHPGGFFRWAALQDARPTRPATACAPGAAFSAGPDHLRLDLGPDCRVDAALVGARRLAAARVRRARRRARRARAEPVLAPAPVRRRRAGLASWPGGTAFSLDGAGAYAEKNWGGGFPDRWWWGQAHDFGDDVSVAFAGGPVGVGPARLHATAAVVRLGGTVLRCRPPASMAAGDGAWRLRARAGAHRIEVEGAAAPGTAHVLTVPVPAERRAVDRSQHHLAGEMRVRVSRRGRMVYAGESRARGAGARGRVGARCGPRANVNTGIERRGPVWAALRGRCDCASTSGCDCSHWASIAPHARRIRRVMREKVVAPDDPHPRTRSPSMTPLLGPASPRCRCSTFATQPARDRRAEPGTARPLILSP